MHELYLNITNLTICFSTVLAGICLILFGKFNRLLLPFVLYVIIGGCFDLVSASFASMKVNNLMFIHLYTIIEFVLISIFFDKVFKYLGSKYDTRKLLFLVSVFIILNSIFIQGLESFNSISSTLSSLIILGYCIYTFLLLIDKPLQGFYVLIKWVIIGLFIYHTTSLTVLALGNVIIAISSEYKPVIWIMRALVILFTKLVYFTVLLRFILKFEQKPLNART